MAAKRPIVVNKYFVSEDLFKYVPPYFRDTPHTPEEVECPTEGKWPTWLSGSFVRTAAGTFTIPLSEDGSKPNAVLQHFFDGLGTLHKFRLDGGQVFYRSRHTAQGVVDKAKKNGYVQTHFFGPNPNTPIDPCYTLYGKLQSLFIPEGHQHPDAANVNVVPRRSFALPPSENPNDRGSPSKDPAKQEIIINTDFNMLQICDAETLAPKRLLTYAEIDKNLAGLGICAHPPKDRKRGTIYNYLVSREGKLHVFGLNYTTTPAKLLWKTPLPCKPCYIHSLAMTGKYVVFIRNPISLDTRDLTKPLADILQFEPDSPTSFFVLDKDTGEFLARYDAPNFMFFHTVNGYDFEESNGDTTIHIDICSYDNATIPYREYSISNIVDPAAPFSDGTLVRYALTDLKAHKSSIDEGARPGRVTVVCAIHGTGMELPRIAKSASMDPSYRYVYATGGNGESAPGSLVPIGRLGTGTKVIQAAFFNSIVKSDWQTGTYLRWKPENGESCPCEPVFVARPGSTEEDDGVVLTIVCNREGTHSVLIALEGKNLQEVARADMPQVYGLGPHGTFIENF